MSQRASLLGFFALVVVGCGPAREDRGTTSTTTTTVAEGHCDTAACGAVPSGATALCPDGTTLMGPTGRCVVQPDGACGWEIVGCPDTSADALPGAEETDTQLAGAVCGTRGAAPCPADQFCDFAAGSLCGADDRGGRCVTRPQMCTRELNPVCGCDGQTHPTACVANSQGVSVAHPGEC